MDISNLPKIKPVSSSRSSYDYYSIRVIGEGKKGILVGTIAEIADEHFKTFNKKLIPSSIFNCASAHRLKYEGFEWRFESEEDNRKYNIYLSEDAMKELVDKNKDNREKIVAYERSGNPVQGFENIGEALHWLRKKTNKIIDFRSIINVAKNVNVDKAANTAGGYQWRFYKDLI